MCASTTDGDAHGGFAFEVSHRTRNLQVSFWADSRAANFQKQKNKKNARYT